MNIYLVLYPNYQTIELADDTSDVNVKYMQNILAIIKLDEEVIKTIKELPNG